MICSLAKLDVEKLQTVTKMEEKLGKTLLAFSCADVEPADLEDGELSELRALEDRLCLQLVAVK